MAKLPHPSTPHFMHNFDPTKTGLYRCPVDTCACLWRDNGDETMSLADAHQHSCPVCENSPLSGMIKLLDKVTDTKMTETEKSSFTRKADPQVDSLGSAPAGQKFDQGKVRMELLPVEAMMGTARVLTFGANKYADRNWEKGIDYSRVYGALMRHMTAWWNGEDLDPETGESHMHHAGCCIAFLQTFVERMQTELDDRPHSTQVTT